MNLFERKLSLPARIGLLFTLAVGGLGLAGYEAGRQDFNNTFNHEPKLALALDDGLLKIGFVTPQKDFGVYQSVVDICGRTEMFSTVIDQGGHFTDQLDFAATVYSVGNCTQGWEWHVRTKPLALTPPTP